MPPAGFCKPLRVLLRSSRGAARAFKNGAGMFSTDRDLLVHEPGLFDEVAWLTQTLFSGASASLDGNGTAALISGINTATMGVVTGNVVRLEGLGPMEVTGVFGAEVLGVSKLRASVAEAPVPAGPPSWTGGASMTTFAPQRKAAHTALLTRLGIAPGDPPESWNEAAALAGAVPFYASQVVASRELADAETLAALAIVWAGAAAHPGSAGGPSRSGAWDRAVWYRERARRALDGLTARVETGGDGSRQPISAAGVRRLRRG